MTHIFHTPLFYYRQFSNDIQRPKKIKEFLTQCRRVTLVALPFIGLCHRFRKPLTIFSSGMRAISSLFACRVAYKTDKSMRLDMLSATVSAISIAGAIFAHPIGMLISTGHDLAINTAHLVRAIDKKDREKIEKRVVRIVGSALYLGLFFSKAKKLSILAISVQILTCIYESRRKFNKDKWLEAGGHALMSVFRCYELVQQVQALRIKKPLRPENREVDAARVPGKLAKENERARLAGEKAKDNPRFAQALAESQSKAGDGVLRTTGTLGPFKYDAASAQGFRNAQEDKYFVEKIQIKVGEQSLDAFAVGVCDGHSGGEVSQFLKEETCNFLQQHLESQAQKNDNQLTEGAIFNALKLACVALDDRVLQLQYKSGSTLCFGVILNGRLWVGNVGDSGAVLGWGDGQFQQLTTDQKPEIEPFTAGVEKRGSTIDPIDPRFPYDDRRVQGLSMARAIGDHNIKNVVPVTTLTPEGELEQLAPGTLCSISPRPKITSYELNDLNDEGPNPFAVFGSDGLSYHASPKQVAQAISQGGYDAQNLTNAALSLDRPESCDNVTTVVLHLSPSL